MAKIRLLSGTLLRCKCYSNSICDCSLNDFSQCYPLKHHFSGVCCGYNYSLYFESVIKTQFNNSKMSVSQLQVFSLQCCVPLLPTIVANNVSLSSYHIQPSFLLTIAAMVKNLVTYIHTYLFSRC